MVDLRSFIRFLEKQEWYSGQIVAAREIPAKEAEYAELREPLPEPLQRYLQVKGIRLYSHQVEAIERIRAGENVVITTPTASGKTLAFNLPIFERLYHDKEATALYLYPLKALTRDQLRVIRELEEATGLDLESAVYDGDTPRHLRPKIRERSRAVLTNPYGLHKYLPWHPGWKRFFRKLKFVVIDEAHRYRGVFGSNVAMLIRRLRRILNHYGSDPQFILSSATIANPEEFSSKLIGKQFTVISKDGSAHGPKYFIFWNSTYSDRPSYLQTADLLALYTERGLQTLCFTISRKLAEQVAHWAKEVAPEREIAPYRAGYLPEERREIERGLKERELDGVAATNALELGVDIGGLDAVIVSGYPGTVISFWQQAGRAGRGTDPALVTFVGFEDPLDQYFMNHPEEFFSRPPEHAIIDLENEHILMGHLLCAAAELSPLSQAELDLFGAEEGDLKPREGKFLQRTLDGWTYGRRDRPVDLVSLNNIPERTVRIFCDGKLLETMDYNRALEEAHPGAVLLHQGETYLVEELDLERDLALAVKKELDYNTEALKTSQLDLLQEWSRKARKGLELGLGKFRVTERVIGYLLRRGGRTLEVRELQLPEVEFETVGLWLALPASLEKEIEWDCLVGGLHGAEHALIAMAPLYAMCDRWDVGGVSTLFHMRPRIFIYDSFPGGIGITEKLYGLLPGWVEATYRLVKDCPCDGGCPSCIYSPKCGCRNESLNKEAAVAILKAIKEALAQ